MRNFIKIDLAFLEDFEVKHCDGRILCKRRCLLTKHSGFLQVLQTAYFIVSLLNDVIGTNAVTKKPPLIRQIKDVLFSITLCTALYVVLVFWIFHTFAKSAIFPIEAEKAFPVWLNHLMHTLILPVILVELLVTKRNYPSKRTGFAVAIILTVIYAGYIHIVYFKYNIWPYPFMYVISASTKIFYFIGSGLLGMVFYLIGEKLDALVSQKYSIKITHLNGTKKIH